MADLFLPATPAFRRLAMAYLSLSPFGFGKWFDRTTCAACNGEGRGFRNDAGEFDRTCTTEREANERGFMWWACAKCRAYGYIDNAAVPLHVPAGLAIARLRITEISQDQHARILSGSERVTAQAVYHTLLTHDPEVRDAVKEHDSHA